MGRCGTKTVRMEYRNISLELCSLLYTIARTVYHSYGVTSDEGSLRYTPRHTDEHHKWCTHRHRTQSHHFRLCPLYYLYVVGVSGRVLCRMSYLQLAREKMMDERI